MIPDELKEIADRVNAGKEPSASVRELLGWFDAQRRGVWVTQRIQEGLNALRLSTKPEFEFAYIDSQVTFVASKSDSQGLEQRHAEITLNENVKNQGADQSGDSLPPSSLVENDPTYRIGKLASANRPPLSVKPDESIERATTLMLSHDYSQLPVMTNEREVKGLISWKTIGIRLGLGRSGQTVREYMDPHVEISADVSLFNAIDLIVASECVLVRDRERKISGMVTTSDLSLQFEQLGEPFLLLGQVENQIRRLVDQRFTIEELGTACDPADGTRKERIQSVSDLTFGEYLRLLENSERWAKLDLRIDRSTFVAQLDDIRRIRNDVMHFDPDGVAENDLATLRRFDQFLQQLSLVATKTH